MIDVTNFGFVNIYSFLPCESFYFLKNFYLCPHIFFFLVIEQLGNCTAAVGAQVLNLIQTTKVFHFKEKYGFHLLKKEANRLGWPPGRKMEQLACKQPLPIIARHFIKYRYRGCSKKLNSRICRKSGINGQYHASNGGGGLVVAQEEHTTQQLLAVHEAPHGSAIQNFGGSGGGSPVVVEQQFVVRRFVSVQCTTISAWCPATTFTWERLLLIRISDTASTGKFFVVSVVQQLCKW